MFSRIPGGLGTILVALIFIGGFGSCASMAYRGAGAQEIGQASVRAGSVVGPSVVGGGPRVGK